MCIISEAFNILGAYFNNAMLSEILHQTIKHGFSHVNWKDLFEEQVLKRRQANTSIENLLQSLMDDGTNYYMADKSLRMHDSKIGNKYIDRHNNNLVNMLLIEASKLGIPLVGIKFKSVFIPRKYFNQSQNDISSQTNREWIHIFADFIAQKHPENLSKDQIFNKLLYIFSHSNFYGRYRSQLNVICDVYKMLNIYFYKTNYKKFTLRVGDSVVYRDSNNILCVATVHDMYLLQNKDNWMHYNLFANFDINFKHVFCQCLPTDLFFWDKDSNIDYYPVIVAQKWKFRDHLQQKEISQGILSLDPLLQPIVIQQRDYFILPCENIMEPAVLACNHTIEKQIFNDWNINDFWKWNHRNCKWCLQCIKHKRKQVFLICLWQK